MYEVLALRGLVRDGVKTYEDLPETRKKELDKALNTYYHTLTKNCPK